MQRKLTRHLIICINSFNFHTYVQHAMKLEEQIRLELGYGGVKFSIFCVFGGCDTYNCCTVQNTTFVSIPQNLSDHNIYQAINYYSNLLPEKATCIMLHDTCTVRQGQFRKKMLKISRYDLQEGDWIFAHALGLYNIGICDVKFAIKHSKNWNGINYLDKQTSIQLEHARGHIKIGGKYVPGLRSYSNISLNATNNYLTEIDSVDFHSIIPIRDGNTNKTRHIIYLGALGVYKFSHTPGSYLLPIWVNEFSPETQEQFDNLTRNKHVQQHEWIRALIPYVPVRITTEDEQASGRVD